MKRILMVMAVVALVAALIGSAALSKVSITQEAQARPLDDTGRTAARSWEYCIISNVSEVGENQKPPNIKFTGLAEVCYASDSGCHTFKIEGTTKADALAKAMAKLGNEGWEMVGESPFPVSAGDRGALFFKRLKS